MALGFRTFTSIRGRRAHRASTRQAVRSPYVRPRPRMWLRVVLAALLFVMTWFYVVAFQLVGQFFIVQFVAPLAIVALLVMWALPDQKSTTVIPIKYLYFLYLVFLLVWPDYLALDLPGLPWITANRLFGFFLAITFVYFLSVSREGRSLIVEKVRSVSYLTKLIIMLAFLITVSIVFSSNMVTTISRVISAFINLFLIFFVSVYLFSKAENVRKFVVVITVCCMINSVIAVAEFRLGHVLWRDYIPSFLAVQDEGVLRTLEGSVRAAIGTYRVQSKFTTPLSFAEFLSLGLPFVFHLALTARDVLKRCICCAVIAVMTVAVFLSDSRLGLVGFLITPAVYLGIWAARRWYSDARSLMGPAITIAYPIIMMTLIAATFSIGRVRVKVWGTGAHQFSNDAREVQWSTGIPKVLSQPWGYGFGEGGTTLNYVTDQGLLTIDSYYLSILLELGLLGFVVFYSIFALTIFHSTRLAILSTHTEARILIPCSISLLNFVITKSVLSQVETHPFAFMILGLAVTSVWQVLQLGINPRKPRIIGPTVFR